MDYKIKQWNLYYCILGTVERFIMVLLAYKMSVITDIVVEGNMISFLQNIPSVVVILIVEILLFHIVGSMAIQVQIEYKNELRESLAAKLLYMPIKEDNQKKRANILNIYNTQIEQVSGLVLNYGEAGIAILTLAVAALYMCTINSRLFLISVMLIPLSGYLYERLMNPIREKSLNIMKQKEEINHIFQESIHGFYLLKAYGLEKIFLNKFETFLVAIQGEEKEKDRIYSFLGRVGIALRYLPQLVIPVYGGWLTYHGEMTLGEMLAANTVIWYVILPIENLISIRKNRKEQQPICENITNFLKENETYFVDSKSEDLIINHLKVDKLDFSYQGKNRVLKEVSLDIKKGEKILLLGESGAGKSTLAKILCGLEEDYRGVIEINHQNVRESGLQLQDYVTYIPQSGYLFSQSILENVCMGKEVEKEKLDMIMKCTGIDTMAERFLEGYDTLVGAGGVSLSGGQKKRISIARAMAADKEIIIMDEPTANLDEAGAKELMRTVLQFWEGKMLIIISHEKDKFTDMDRTYVIKEGEMDEWN